MIGYIIPLTKVPISKLLNPISDTRKYLKAKNKTTNKIDAIPIDLLENLACSSTTPFATSLFGLAPIGNPSGEITYLFFKKKKTNVPKTMAIPAIKYPHLNTVGS